MGGALFTKQDSIINVNGSVFVSNSATDWGGVLLSISSTITIEASEFYDNSATRWGGVLDSTSSIITIEASEFHDNNATWGGVLASFNSTITIASSNFTNNVSPIGAIIYAASRSVIQHTYSHFLINNNTAGRYAVIYLSDSEFIGDDSGKTTVQLH